MLEVDDPFIPLASPSGSRMDGLLRRYRAFGGVPRDGSGSANQENMLKSWRGHALSGTPRPPGLPQEVWRPQGIAGPESDLPGQEGQDTRGRQTTNPEISFPLHHHQNPQQTVARPPPARDRGAHRRVGTATLAYVTAPPLCGAAHCEHQHGGGAYADGAEMDEKGAEEYRTRVWAREKSVPRSGV
jgi:hypothetical protein